MSDRMSTRIRYDRIRDNGAISRTRNGTLKRKERTNRDERMTKLIKSGKFPYTQSIQSWISTKLGIPFSKVKEEDIKSLTK
jgi:hypothetical protein